MRHITLPDWATELLSGYAPKLGKRTTSYIGDETCHVIGSPIMHPRRNVLACIVRHTERIAIHMESMSGGTFKRARRPSTRFRYANGRVWYVLYIVNRDAGEVIHHEQVSDLLTIKRDLIAIGKEWH